MHAYATWPEALQHASELVELKITSAADAGEFFARMSEFSNLAVLRLSCGIPDLELSALTPPPALRELSLIATEVAAEVDRACTVFPGIESLAIWGRHLQEQILPSSIGTLSRLRSLELVSCGLSDLPDALAELGALRDLRIGDCPIRHFPLAITRLPGLKRLSLRGQLRSLPEELAQLQSLEHLNLSGSLNGGLAGSQAATLAPIPAVLGALAALRSLDLGQCGVDDRLEPLARLSALRSLDISWGQVSDLSGLAQLVHLEELSLESCYRITDLEPLTALPALRRLNINSAVAIEDLSALSRLQRLEELEMEGCTSLTSLRPVLEHGTLHTLRASDAVLEKYQGRGLLSELPGPETLVRQLASNELEECAMALWHVSIWVQRISPEERSAIGDFFGVDGAEPHHVERELVDIAGLDGALQRWGPQLPSALLVEVVRMSLVDVESSYRTTLIATKLLADREDAAAQLEVMGIFLKAYGGGERGQRRWGRSVLDQLIDTYFPVFLPAALARLLDGCSTGALRADKGDALFVAALAQGDALDAVALDSLVATFARYARDMIELGHGEHIDALRVDLRAVHAEAGRAIGLRMAAVEREALVHERVEGAGDADALSTLVCAMIAGEPGHSFAELDGISGFSARVVEHYSSLPEAVRLATLESSWLAMARGWDWARLLLMELERDPGDLHQRVMNWLAAHTQAQYRAHLVHMLPLAERLLAEDAPADSHERERVAQCIRELQRALQAG